jgi:hypothetical protein
MPQPEQLPGPNADIWDWQLQGLCRGVDSSVFFHPDGERGRARLQRERRAKEMCRSCPVMAQCRTRSTWASRTESGAACRRPNANCCSSATSAGHAASAAAPDFGSAAAGQGRVGAHRIDPSFLYCSILSQSTPASSRISSVCWPCSGAPVGCTWCPSNCTGLVGRM